MIGWLAAYALVLHAVLAGALGAQIAAAANVTGFEICLSSPDGQPLPGHAQGQHESCAIHCAAAGGLPLLALAFLALLLPSRSVPRTAEFVSFGSFAHPRRAGLSRAPPLPA